MKYKTSTILSFFFLFFVSLGFVKNANSQTTTNGKIVAFHPSVGNSITVSEKKELQLFTEYNDSLFESAQLIRYSADSYSVLIKTTKGNSFEKPVSLYELDAIYATIEKVKPFASTKSNDDYLTTETDKQVKRKDHSESVFMMIEVSFQVLFLFFEIMNFAY